MPLSIDWLAIDTPDPDELAAFWCAALDYEVLHAGTDNGEREVLVGGGGRPRLLFLENNDTKTVKNRLHLDLRPHDLDSEVERLLSLGATKVDIGQGDVSWVVLADPHGNEFCVLRTPRPEELAERREMEAQGKW